MRWWWSFSRTYSVVAAAACVILFVVALVGGIGVTSFGVLAAAVVWVAMAKYESGRARAAHRHHELRRRRLERMREGTWTGPYRND